MAHREQIDALWSRVESEFKHPDWSLGNALYWITCKNPLLICEFDGRRDLLGYGHYDHRRSGLLYPEPLIARADQVLLSALKRGQIAAIHNGAELSTTSWLGKEVHHLPDDLRFRRDAIMQLDWLNVVTGDHSAGEPRSALPGPKHPVPSSGNRQRGPLAKKFNLVKEAMIADLLSGERDPNKMREKDWPPVYGASRDTCRKALKAANQEFRATNSDKLSANDK